MQKQTRQEKEDALWRDTFDQFKSVWSTRTNDQIERGHPQEFWAWKQRKKFRDGSLPDWRKDMLLSIGFPLDAARIKAQNDNMSHAKSLVDFFLHHGHCGPTITIGGGALTHWVRRMRDSNGRSGVVSDAPGSAEQANEYLKAHIPGFSWDDTFKSDYNESAGKTHNGYRPSLHLKHGSRAQEVIRRARASKLFRFRPGVMPYGDDDGAPIHNLLRKCAFYEQAARVRLPEDRAGDEWWLEGMEFSSDGEGCDDTWYRMNFKLARAFDYQDTTLTIERKEFSCLVAWDVEDGTYSDDGALFFVNLFHPSGQPLMTLDMDVPLADQTHPGAHPTQWFVQTWENTPPAKVDWDLWSDRKTFPATCASSSTTANATFNENLNTLRDFLVEHQAHARNPVHVGFGHLKLFKFLEHMNRKMSAGILPPSHRERLSELHFTWGANKATAYELFMSELDSSVRAAPPQLMAGCGPSRCSARPPPA